MNAVKSAASYLGGLELKFSETSLLGKHSIIGSLQEEERKVATVGDGIKDYIALAQEDLGIAQNDKEAPTNFKTIRKRVVPCFLLL